MCKYTFFKDCKISRHSLVAGSWTGISFALGFLADAITADNLSSPTSNNNIAIRLAVFSALVIPLAFTANYLFNKYSRSHDQEIISEAFAYATVNPPVPFEHNSDFSIDPERYR